MDASCKKDSETSIDLGLLSSQERDLVGLRYFKDEDYEQIGKKLGIKSSTVRKRMSRILEKLRIKWKGRQHEPK